MARTAIIVSASVLVVLGVLVARMSLLSRAELARAGAASEPAHSRHLRRALAHYYPGNPWTRTAAERLRDLARRAAAAGDRPTALSAWRQLRSALVALRGPYQPYAALLPEINERIAALSAVHPEAAAELTTAGGKAALHARLSSPPRPGRGWVALGLIGFLLWVGGAVALLALGLDASARRVPRRFWALLGGVALGLLLFFAGMAAA